MKFTLFVVIAMVVALAAAAPADGGIGDTFKQAYDMVESIPGQFFSFVGKLLPGKTSIFRHILQKFKFRKFQVAAHHQVPANEVLDPKFKFVEKLIKIYYQSELK